MTCLSRSTMFNIESDEDEYENLDDMEDDRIIVTSNSSQNISQGSRKGTRLNSSFPSLMGSIKY